MKASWWKLGGALLLLVVGGYLGGRLAGLWGKAPIRIGTVLPLTGPGAATGIAMKNAMTLAVDDVNRKGGIHGRRVELVALDEAEDPQKALAAATQLVDDPTVVAATAHVSEGGAMITSDEYARGHLPVLFAGAIDHDLFYDVRVRPEMLRIVPTDEILARESARYDRDVLGLRRFYLVQDGVGLDRGMIVVFRRTLESVAEPVVVQEVELKPEEHDFKGHAEFIKLARSEVVYFAGEPRQAAELVTAMRAAGVTARLQLATKFPPLEFIALAKGNAEGTLATFVGLLPEETKEGRQFLEAYSAAGYKEPPGIYGMYAHANMQVVLSALEKSALNRRSVLAALRAGQFDTVVGPVHFDHDGEVGHRKIAVYQVIGGRWVPVRVTDDEGRLVPYVKG